MMNVREKKDVDSNQNMAPEPTDTLPFDSEEVEHIKTAYDLLEDTTANHLEQNTDLRSEKQIRNMINKVKYFHIGMDEDPLVWMDPAKENQSYMRMMISYKRGGRGEIVKIGTSQIERSAGERMGLV